MKGKKVMILKSALEIRNSIEQDRQKMYKLAKALGISDPNVCQISQQLDKKILKMQQLIKLIRA
ncbi:Spo0E family sporulation regulatory protein-aspartic acid phosphatase [Peribacillus butanolivorans]|uniref:Spo0E family sporulation regulatory protein-aspartic acid phosphatase n=1 Tax=Peribacillus butanolivorans TaxID=421767 RepID=UPI003662B087